MNSPEQKATRGARIAPPLEETALPDREEAQAETSHELLVELRKGIEELKVFTGNPSAIHEGNQEQVVKLIESLSAKAEAAGTVTKMEIGATICAIQTESNMVILAKVDALSNLKLYDHEFGMIAALQSNYKAGKRAA